MAKREFKAKVVDNFKDLWLMACAKNENITKAQAVYYYEDADLDKLAERISGKEATIIENSHDGIQEKGFFEKEDNNFVIFPCLFEEISNT